MPDPLGTEFFKTFTEFNHGLDLNTALLNLCDRIDLRDLSFFTTAVLIQRETGGNLTEILEKISILIRERFKLRNQVKALTAEGRLSGAYPPPPAAGAGWHADGVQPEIRITTVPASDGSGHVWGGSGISAVGHAVGFARLSTSRCNMEIVQVVFFGLLIGGMITFLGIFLQQRHSSVRRRLQANPRLNTDLLRPQMARQTCLHKRQSGRKARKEIRSEKRRRQDQKTPGKAHPGRNLHGTGHPSFSRDQTGGTAGPADTGLIHPVGTTPTSAAC